MVSFGYFLVPNAADPLIETARLAESLGLEYVGIQDHPYQRRYVDTMVLSSAILTATSSLRVFPDVACLPLRPPGVLAKTAASLDVLSGGRFELGLGAGAFWDAIEGYGGVRRTPGEALAALAEAIEVIRLLWGGERGLRFEGSHYHLRGVHSGPLPAHDLGIWVGAYGPRALALTGRLADGWVPSVNADVLKRLPELNERVDTAAAEAGRDPSAVRRVYNVGGTITDGVSEGYLAGPVSQWIDELSALAADHRADVLLFGGPPSQLRTFAEQIVPAVTSSPG
ncbi:Luciferase-like monooxygenase [Jiangella alkaliphila]|uniref:Luciferase-like monooxygenase n=1 Tax=Jiangella alkaliphila TaxID=419479 RepID=A0A1H2JMJ7_9ACTN|nr:LLM class flavin-dependent oxidoreductase [Jiangella alkaliphila]SDU57557.1 Luciferase-like monooxygenase [Jiangella alkaliphila]